MSGIEELNEKRREIERMGEKMRILATHMSICPPPFGVLLNPNISGEAAIRIMKDHHENFMDTMERIFKED